VALKAELEEHDEAQMRAAKLLRASLPIRIALTLQAAFRAVRATEERLLDDGRCLVLVARHFVETWKPCVKKARTLSQKVRERDLGQRQMPACSRRAVHAHHVEPRSHGGADTPDLVALCACHHVRGIHVPDELVRCAAPHAAYALENETDSSRPQRFPHVSGTAGCDTMPHPRSRPAIDAPGEGTESPRP